MILRVYDMKHTRMYVSDMFDEFVTIIQIGATPLVTRQNHKKEGTSVT
jgi:hypothetical protein